MARVAVVDCGGDKRSLDATVIVDGRRFELKHDHWHECLCSGPVTTLEALDGGECRIVKEEYCKYHYSAVLEIEGVQIALERTYSDGVFVAVNGGPRCRVACTVDMEEFEATA